MLKYTFSFLLLALGALGFAYEALLLFTPHLSLVRFPNPAAIALLDTPCALGALGAAYLAFEHHRLRHDLRSALLTVTLAFTGITAFAYVLAPPDSPMTSPVDANVAPYFFFLSYLTAFVAIALGARYGAPERVARDQRWSWIGAAVLPAAALVVTALWLGRFHLPLLALPFGGLTPKALVSAGALSGVAALWALFAARRGVGREGDGLGASLFVAAFIWVVGLTGFLLDPFRYSVAWYVAAFARPLGMAVIFLGLLGDQIALYREARDRQHDLEGLQAASQALLESLEPQRVADTVTTNALMLTGAGAAVLHALDELSGALHSVSSTGRLHPGRLRSVENAVAASVARQATAEGRGVWSGDLRDDDRFNTIDATAEIVGEGFRAVQVVPLGMKAGAVSATLTVLFERPREFSARERELFEAYGRQAAAAIENGWAVERLREKARHDEALQDFALRLLAATASADVLGDAARVARRLLRADCAGVYVRDAGTEEFRLAAGSGWAPGTLNSAAESPGSDSLVGEAVLRNAIVQVEDLKADSAFVPAPYLRAHAMHAAFVAPLAADGRASGAIGVFWRGARRFRDEETRVLSVIAEQTGLALGVAPGSNGFSSRGRVREAREN